MGHYLFPILIVLMAIAVSSHQTLDNELQNCVIPRSAWTSAPLNSEVEDLEGEAPLAIILHTVSQSCKNSQECKEVVKSIRNYHVDVLGFDDIGYNFLVGGDGLIYEGRGWGKRGAHTFGFNSQSVGIAFIGKYHDTFPIHDSPTSHQVSCTKRLLVEGVTSGWLASNYSLVGYCDLMSGIPPGNILVQEIRKWPHYRKEGNPGICK
ncbi:peptidoglycan recognition protein-like [Ctenocephalides felis]|uniref:peptidoglycan recognition protein-like n=1 Tax=Ctenocephalides felis TaxID=7515 RepID=UPI000E6E13F1|nr:peptidoglycan recognition protein-like [Ctenocephalides felis]